MVYPPSYSAVYKGKTFLPQPKYNLHTMDKVGMGLFLGQPKRNSTDI